MKFLFLSIMAIATVLACTRRSAPADTEIIISNKSEARAGNKTASASNSSPAGQLVYTSKCGSCHALKKLDRYNSSEWENILASMIPKAKLNGSEAKEVRAYVFANARK